MLAQEQAIETGHLSFWFSLVSAWTAWTGALCLAAIDIQVMPNAIEASAALLKTTNITLAACTAGAMIGLFCGSPLSRGFCLIFGGMIGAFIAPIVMTGLWLGWPFGPTTAAVVERILLWAWTASIALGAVLGLVQSRRIGGLARPSRRAAARGLLYTAIGMIPVSFMWVLVVPHHIRAAVPFWDLLLLLIPLLLTPPCIFAALHGEARQARGFDVLGAES